VTGDRVADLLEEVDRPFVDSVDIAEYLDVTPQAVRNKHEKLAEAPQLESGDAGQTRVYWLAKNDTPEQAEPEPEPPTGGSRSREFESEPTETEDTERESGLLDKLGLRSGESAAPVDSDSGPGAKTLFERLASGSTVTVGALFVIIAALVVSTGFLSPIPGTVAAATGAVFLTLGAVTFWIAALAQIALGRPLPVIGTQESETT
jgi:hypothetical protein